MEPAVITVLLLEPDAAIESALAAAGLRVTVGADLTQARAHDTVLLNAPTAADLVRWAARPDLAQAAFESAMVILAPHPDVAQEDQLLALGVEAIVSRSATLPRALRHALMRKRFDRDARSAYATDLATGLPHQSQLLEHMTQLLALREREPAPMVLLVIRVEGYAVAASRFGAEAANILRRKVAVRLRGGLRASDVVAAIGPDAFGVLLGHVEALPDGERVAAKLARSLRQPIAVAGQPCHVQPSVGLALYPEHGKDAQSLLQRASAQAGSIAAIGREGYAAPTVRRGEAAANDDES